MDPFHVTLGRLVKKAYSPLFITDPVGVHVDDLGMTRAETFFAKDPGGDTVPYGIAATGPDGLNVGFCGTRTGVQWIADGLARLVNVPWAPGCRGHEGILGVFDSMVTSQGIPVWEWIESRPAMPLNVGGHSLGAELASMLARRMAARLLVSLAGPRGGDEAFARYGEQRIGGVARYVVGSGLPPWGDLVPCLPEPLPPLFPFWHIGQPITLAIPAGIKREVSCLHSIDTYLHALDPSNPLDQACLEP